MNNLYAIHVHILLIEPWIIMVECKTDTTSKKDKRKYLNTCNQRKSI